MEHEIRIIGVNIVDPTKRTSRNGTTLSLAFFDVIANGIEMRGCSFVRTKNYGLTVFPPRLEAPGAARRSVVFAQDSLRAAVVHAVQKAYEALGGTEGDWLRTEDPRRGARDVRRARRRARRTAGLSRREAGSPRKLNLHTNERTIRDTTQRSPAHQSDIRPIGVVASASDHRR